MTKKNFVTWLGGLVIGLGLLTVVDLLGLVKLTDYFQSMADQVIDGGGNDLVRCLKEGADLLGLLVLIKVGKSYLLAWFVNQALLGIRNDFFSAILRAENLLTHSIGLGERVSAFSIDMARVESLLKNLLPRILYTCLSLLVFSPYLIRLNPKGTYLMVFTSLLLLLVSRLMTNKLGPNQEVYLSHLDRSNILIEEVLEGFESVRGNGMQGLMMSKFKNVMTDCKRAGLKIEGMLFKVDLVVSFFQLAPYIILCLSSYMGLKSGRMTTGGLVAYMTLYQGLYSSLTSLPYLYKDLVIGLTSIKRLKRLMKGSRERGGGVSPKELKDDRGPLLALEGVSLTYPNGVQALRGVSFKLKRGQVLRVVGTSGSGKTSLVNLICKFIQADQGSISLRGHDFKEMTGEEVRKNIALVAQEVCLFSTSVASNIAYGNPNMDEDTLLKASKIAEAHPFIMEMDLAYDSLLMNGARELSGGERQRIAIARALVKKCHILILDEGTSQLDRSCRQRIEKQVTEAMGDRGCLMITHDLERLGDQDHILFLDKGEVKGQGTYKELVMTNCVFKAFCERGGADCDEVD